MKTGEANERVIKLKSVHNARQFAGIINKNGKTVRAGLMRSAAFDRISRRDFERLKNEYGLTKVIDLRTDEETERKPDRRCEGVEYVHIPIISERMLGISRERRMSNTEILNSLPDMRDMYRTLVTEDSCRRNIAQVLRNIMDHREGAIMWHCTAGKDRCGLISAIVLFMLQVDDETILSDYLLTNDDPGQRGYGYSLAILLMGGGTEKAKAVRRMFTADKEFISAAAKAIAESYKDMDDFIENGLGISRDEIEQFRAYALA